MSHPFQQFLDAFVPQVAAKQKQLHQALWLLEITGSSDASDLRATLDTELRLLFNDKTTYEKLQSWQGTLENSLLERQLNVLLRTFKRNLIQTDLLEKIAREESQLLCIYANFRPQLEGQFFSENSIREILKNESNPKRRQKAWEASKEIGNVLADPILSLVNLRNKAAESLGYADYFKMQLDLQEVDETWLFSTFDNLAEQSDEAYTETIRHIEEVQSQKFDLPKEELGPWAWAEPFCQEDPLENSELDALVAKFDLSEKCKTFYQKMGFDVQPTLERSDLFERPGKNQHAFCINMDRKSDVRTLNNLAPTIKWLETLLHELGHAIYELGFDEKLPWLLREPPHMLATEAIALIAGRQAYSSPFLIGDLAPKAIEGLIRRQQIFSRWVLVMTYFERELYQNPHQDLNKLWWSLVQKFQKITPPLGRENKNDWAAKYHISLSPVYYYSYLLGEMFASAIEYTLEQKLSSSDLANPEVGRLLQQKLFQCGNSMAWDKLITHVTGEPLNAKAWLQQMAHVKSHI